MKKRNTVSAVTAFALALLAPAASPGQYYASTFSGGLPGEGTPATEALIGALAGVAAGADGSVYLAVPALNRVCVITPDGELRGLPADGAMVYPTAVAAGPNGSVFIAETLGHRVLRADPSTGAVVVVAGSGAQGFTGDGGSALQARLSRPAGLAVDAAGNVYIADSYNHRVRRVDAATGVITTVAGTGAAGFNGDGIPATKAALAYPGHLALDTAGALYIADTENHRVRKVDPASGLIATVAGSGIAGSSANGVPARQANLRRPAAVAVDAAGNIYVSDSGNSRVRKVDSGTGAIATIAGASARGGFAGDGGPAVQALLNGPSGLALTPGRLLIADSDNFRLRALDLATGVIRTIAGNGIGDGGEARNALLQAPSGVCVLPDGGVAVADSGARRVRLIDGATGRIRTIAGGGAAGLPTGAALAAEFGRPEGLAAGPGGRLYITDAWWNGISALHLAAGTLDRIAGSGEWGYGGDGEPAVGARFRAPSGVAVGRTGEVLIADNGNHRIRRIDPNTRIIETVVGTGVPGYNRDGAPGAITQLDYPTGVATDQEGNLYIADAGTHRIRKMDVHTGLVTTVAGNGADAFAGDGGPAVAASLRAPADVAVDAAGNLYIADRADHRVRLVSAETGFITTIAGDGQAGFDGDGGPASSARLSSPRSVAVDSEGRVYVAEMGGHRIRLLTPEGLLSAVTVTSDPPGLPIEVDGERVTTPARFAWIPGSRHSLGAPAAVDGKGRRHRFDAWGHGAAQAHEIIAPAGSATYTARFRAQHRLAVSSLPADGGAVKVSPPSPDGYYDAGTLLEVTAIPSAGSVFVKFTGDLTGPASPRTLTMSGPVSVTAVFSHGGDAAPGGLATVSAASYRAGEAAPAMIVASYGANLAAETALAATEELPAELAGTRVYFTDSSGRQEQAGIFFVSPGQVNWLVPEWAAAGEATVTVRTGAGAVVSGSVMVAATAPGLFTANADGQGAPAAVAVRVDAAGNQETLPVFACRAAQGACSPVPLDLSKGGDVVLLLFGTGIRGFQSIRAWTGDRELPVLGAQAQPDYAGLDQVNVLLPPDLDGDVAITVEADGKPANPVTVAVTSSGN